MKIETLNIWGGRVYKPLIKQQGETVDIFCFQEVFNKATTSRPIHQESVMDIFGKLEDALPEHTGYFDPAQDNEKGLATFIKKSIPLQKHGNIFVYRWKSAMVDNDARTLGRNMQYFQFDKDGKTFTVANLHGLWNGIDKTDSPDRLEQSRKAKEFLDGIKGEKILCGDFNLLPDTESLTMLEQNMRNLVKEYCVTSTRSSFYTKPEKFADYILVSPEITVRDFRVLQETVSDHLPLILEF